MGHEHGTPPHETLLRSAFEHGLVGMALLTQTLKIVEANAALGRFLGYPPGELAGMTLSALVYEGGAIPDALTGPGRPTPDLLLRKKTGDPVWAQVSTAAFQDGQGGVWGLAIVQDISGQKQTEEERRVLEVRVRQAQKMDAVGQLTGGIAHDFNNMLTVILANAELIAEALAPAQQDTRADLEELRGAARRGTAVVRKLLGFSRRERLALQALNLGRLIADLTATLRRLLPETIELRLNATDERDVRVDPTAVEQILANLLTNARDAMPQGGKLSVTTRPGQLDEDHRRTQGWGDPGQYVCLSVADTGIGMDDRVKARLFEPFFTTKAPGLGTGLGMAMIYGLVKQHGGFVDVQSDPGRGTTVTVYLPVSAPAEAAAAPVTEHPLQGGTETILLVEDEEPIRRAARRVLERFGYRVLVAPDGEAALTIIREQGDAIQLVISDVVMPKLSGRALYDAARSAGAKMKFLFASGYTARDIGSPGGEIDPNLPFIHKPWTIPDFIGRVREVLDS